VQAATERVVVAECHRERIAPRALRLRDELRLFFLHDDSAVVERQIIEARASDASVFRSWARCSFPSLRLKIRHRSPN